MATNVMSDTPPQYQRFGTQGLKETTHGHFTLAECTLTLAKLFSRKDWFTLQNFPQSLAAIEKAFFPKEYPSVAISDFTRGDY
jgi:hypothetical protein